MKYKFTQCGCELELDDNNIPIINYDDVLDRWMDCSATWALIGSGNTKNVFQLESRLGQSFAKKLKPENIEQLAALVSILRPGCLEAYRNGKTVTQHYIDRKNKVENVEYYHPSLENALHKTYGEMIYQENAMQIAKDIAGFTLQEADELRKAIGKKLPEVMAKVKIKFLDGCKKLGMVNEEQAQFIFDQIEKSQRYSFNKSHAVSYAIDSYLSAYAKAHFPRAFITSCLDYSNECTKPHEEISEICQNARLMNISILPPDLCKNNTKFKLIDGKIYFGIGNIKGVGDSILLKLNQRLKEIHTLLGIPNNCYLNWVEFLIYITPYINSIAIRALICSGALSYLNISRNQMLYEYNRYNKIGNKIKTWIENEYINNKFDSFKSILQTILTYPTGRIYPCTTKNQKALLEEIIKDLDNPPYSLIDNAEWKAREEQSLLGIAITCDSFEDKDVGGANMTCKDFIDGKCLPDIICLAVTINRSHEVKTKRVKTQAKLWHF